MSQAAREAVAQALSFSAAVERADLCTPDSAGNYRTQSDLVALLARAVLMPKDGGLGYQLLVTSLRSDHGDDSQLGPHGHARGFAVDLWPVHEDQLQNFLEDMAHRNKWVTKIGLGGSSQRFYNELQGGSTIVFLDNSSDHVHLQTV